MIIIPKPQKIEIYEEKIKATSFKVVSDCDEIKKFTDAFSDKNASFYVLFIKNDMLEDEHYTIEIKRDKVVISYGETEGAYRAFTTFKQIIAQNENGEIPCLFIDDYPAFKNRGYMLDVSRGRIPTFSHLRYMVDILSELKYNQLQLYMDNFVYEFKHFSDYWKNMDPITADELKELNSYCKERFISLVPNLNGFGHMGAWTSKEEFSHLAITDKEGKPSATLNPFLPESLELLDKIYDGFFDSFSSELANIGMDEPFELGLNETKEECDKVGIGKVYTDYLKKVCSLITNKYGKTPMFWDDIIFKHEEQVENIPKNAIVMEWGYEGEQKFDRNCRRLQEKGLRFYVCPGTSMWGTFTGRTNNAILNMSLAAECGNYYGAEGFLLTEWGDGGHPQFPSTAMFPLVYGGAVSWNCMNHNHEVAYDERRELINDCKAYLDKYIYNSIGKFSLADIVYRMGNYYILEDLLLFNRVELRYFATQPDKMTDRNREAFGRVYNYMLSLKNELKSVRADENAVREIENNCDTVIFLSGILSGKKDNYREKADKLIQEYEVLWERNSRLSGMKQFVNFINKTLEANEL